ncbi:hypothetical protein BJ912DRAFT_976195 [Pholiota molesta]|nr:hypothetical protein BJ912DRAFT_976195 [Pholiota molesta]
MPPVFPLLSTTAPPIFSLCCSLPEVQKLCRKIYRDCLLRHHLYSRRSLCCSLPEVQKLSRKIFTEVDTGCRQISTHISIVHTYRDCP